MRPPECLASTLGPVAERLTPAFAQQANKAIVAMAIVAMAGWMGLPALVLHFSYSPTNGHGSLHRWSCRLLDSQVYVILNILMVVNSMVIFLSNQLCVGVAPATQGGGEGTVSH